MALVALTEGSDVETGEPCTCSCHPRLPVSDHHDVGLACRCTQTRDERRESFRRTLDQSAKYQRLPEGLRARETGEAAETELRVWLAQQPGVVVHSIGGVVPEQWHGEVDGHGFYFRERDGHWHVELDRRRTRPVHRHHHPGSPHPNDLARITSMS